VNYGTGTSLGRVVALRGVVRLVKGAGSYDDNGGMRLRESRGSGQSAHGDGKGELAAAAHVHLHLRVRSECRVGLE
jgi:hypothetical protein